VINITSKHAIYILPLLFVLLFADTALALPTITHGTVQGEMYVSSTATWPSSASTNNFNVPNGTVIFAQYYAGVWKGQGSANSLSTTFNGHTFPTNPSYYTTEMGVTWIPYNVTDYVHPGETNTATTTSVSWGDGRQYGSTLVVVLKNESKPQIEYWIADGLDWMHYDGYLGYDASNSTTYFNGTVNLADVQNASLYSTHLTGFNYEDLNGKSLPTAAESVNGEYFNYIRWDNVQGLLVPENQTVLVSRGDDSYCSVGLHALSLVYKTADLVPVSLTPSLVTPNVTNTMTATIENRGGKDSQPFKVSLMVNGNVVDTQPASGLTIGSNTTVDLHWIPDGNADSYSLTVVADPENIIDESDESNNIFTALVGTTSASLPVADFSADKTSGDSPLSVNLTDNSTNSPTAWAWDFNNDGTIDSTSQNPIYTFTAPGNYTVNLTVNNAGGSDSEVKPDYIIVSGLFANFTATPTFGNAPLTVAFTDQSSGSPTSWFWDFGDGTNSTSQNPSHTYNTDGKAGNYTISLTVTNVGGTNSTMKKDYISTSAIAPVAQFSVNKTYGVTPATIQFTDKSTYSPTSWAWDFNNDSIIDSTEQNPSYTYTEAGTYAVTLTVINSVGSDNETKTNYITTSATGPEWAAKSAWNGPSYRSQSPSPALADLDGDGDYDLLIGIDSGITYSYENTGTTNNPVWTAKSAWNAPDIGSTINDYPAPSVADLDSDGDSDLLIGANPPDYKGVPMYAYENTGNESSPVWAAKSAWNGPHGLNKPRPTLADLDGDGDYDMLYGLSDGISYGYENTGTMNSPVWTAKSAWNAPDIGMYAEPKLADLDNDGDYDLLIGSSDGICYGYENTGTVRSPVWTAKSIWNTPSVGWYARPALADLDNDGDSDLLICEYNGNMYGYENVAPVKAVKPDLIVTKITPQSNITVTAPATISAVFSNIGTGDAGVFNATLSVNGTVVDTQSLSGISSGSGAMVNFSWAPTKGGIYRLTVSADAGYTIVESKETNNVRSVLVTALGVQPIADFTAIPLSGDAPLTVQFNDTSANVPTSWTWDFNNDGIIDSTTQNPVYTYTIPGNYVVSFTAANTGGNSIKTSNLTVTTPAAPVANFTTDNTIGGVPFTVNFTDTSTGVIAFRAWDFNNDGTIDSTVQNPTYTYTIHGNYTVNLTVENAGGTSSAVKMNYITVIATGPEWVAKSAWNAPDVGSYASSALFDIDRDRDCDLLIGASDGITYGYENTGTANSPVWTTKSSWNAPDIGSRASPDLADIDGDGDYDLMIGSNDGITYGYENTGTANSPVWTAKSSWNAPDIGSYASPTLVDIDGDGDYDLMIGANNGITYGYENTGNASSPIWTQKSAWNTPDIGSYASPTLVDIDGDGDYDLMIGASDGITYGYENTGNASSPVWTAKSSWNAPDIGSYANPTLSDIDEDGDSDLLIGSNDGITYGYENVSPLKGVKQDLVPTAVALPSEIIMNTPCTIGATINNTGKGNSDVFNATLSVDGTVVDTQAVSGISSDSSALVNFTWTPTAAGDYNLTVTADPENGIVESDEMNNALTVLVTVSTSVSSLVSNFTADVTSGIAPLTVSFTDQSTGSPASWFWDFGDGTTSTEQHPSHTYTSAGNYSVNLTVTNAGGSDSEIKTDYIVISAQETLDTTIPVIDSIVLFPANTTAGSTINISVNATDNKEVTGVVAGTVPLVKDSDGIWQGRVTAPSAVGSYSLSINASDASGNTAETSMPYNVVQLSGSSSIAVSPKISSVAAGSSVSPAIIVKNSQSIDDTFKVWISVSELPASSQANLTWFDWTEKSVKIRAGEEVSIPVKVDVPAGTVAGRKLFRVNVKSETVGISGFNTGYLTIA
jgi:PKD repeat protein